MRICVAQVCAVAEMTEPCREFFFLSEDGLSTRNYSPPYAFKSESTGCDVLCPAILLSEG